MAEADLRRVAAPTRPAKEPRRRGARTRIALASVGASLTSGGGVAARRGAQRLAIRRRHRSGVGSLRAVSREAADHGDHVTDFHGVAQPAALLQLVRRTHLARPARPGTVFLLDVDVEPDVRIGPVDLRDDA